jgi:1-acyl-sn-glycerol-3-phosphate acyltransferase
LILARKLIRTIAVLWVFLYSLTILVLTRPRTRPARALWLSKFCRRVLKAAHVTFEVEGPIPMQGGVITNHLNYTDILIHSAMRPCVFVSKAELRKTPVIGWISFMAGTQYVERGAGGQAEKAAQGMAKGFRDGLPIVFFPEGTTGVGEPLLLPFRSGLLAQTIEAEQPITPGWIHYTLTPQDLANGFTPQKDLFWGHRPLLPHLWRQVGFQHTHAIVRFATEPITFSPEAVADRKIAAQEAHAVVLALSEPLQEVPEGTR